MERYRSTPRPSLEDFEATKRVHRYLLTARRDVRAEVIGELADPMREESSLAQKDSTKEAARVLKRRKLIKYGLIYGAPIVLGGGTISSLAWRLFRPLTSEELAANNAASDAKNLENKNKNLKIEREQNLDLTPTAISTAGWRAKHIIANSSTQYRKHDSADSVFTVKADTNFSLLGDGTSMVLNPFPRSDSSIATKLSITLAGSLKEDWLLQDANTPKEFRNPLIDPRFILFEKPKTNITYIVSISPTKSETPSYNMSILVKKEDN